ncbi:MAG: hypothetical protein PHX43_05365 [Alphaproteobacteria bacterium]|nr:hypothetical protein [Alphaproteobacteria bacterium]
MKKLIYFIRSLLRGEWWIYRSARKRNKNDTYLNEYCKADVEATEELYRQYKEAGL